MRLVQIDRAEPLNWFPIPMRGNEMVIVGPDGEHLTVSDPHEG